MLKTAMKDDNLRTIILIHLYRPYICFCPDVWDLHGLYSQLNQEVSAILAAGYPVVVIGDFNGDLFKTPTRGHCSLTFGLQQINTDPTHITFTLICMYKVLFLESYLFTYLNIVLFYCIEKYQNTSQTTRLNCCFVNLPKN